MHTNHPAISEPKEDTKIWRYMDFWKFKDLLNRKCLFFTRIDDFDDFFEGKSSDELHSLFEIYKKRTYANCWHQNDYESNLMWQAYIKDSVGIVIQSSFVGLCQCFKESKIEQYIGKVTYDNSDLQPEENTLIPFFRKRKEFKSEKEIRTIVQIMDIKEKNPEKGIHINVNLAELIEKIYTSPNSSDVFFNEVKKVASKFNFEKCIKKSELLYQRPNTFKKQAPEIIIEPNPPNETDASGNIINRTGIFSVRGQKKYDN